MNNIKSYVQEHKDRFINELIELLKIPSVSADASFSKDVIKMAGAVKISLENEIYDWQGSYEQTDDILLIGLTV